MVKILHDRFCSSCGKTFDVQLSSKNKIPKTVAFWGHYQKAVGKGRWLILDKKKAGYWTTKEGMTCLKRFPIFNRDEDIETKFGVRWTGKWKYFEDWECPECLAKPGPMPYLVK